MLCSPARPPSSVFKSPTLAACFPWCPCSHALCCFCRSRCCCCKWGRMTIPHQIGRHLRGWLRQQVGTFFGSQRGMAVTPSKLGYGGINDTEWKPISRARSEEPPPEPWMKSAMDTLNKELLRQGTRFRGKSINPSLIPQSPAAEYEKIYENYFLSCSHGFRHGLSQHTCLKQVRRDFEGTVWYIEGKSLSKCFDQIPPGIVNRLLKGKIRPKKIGPLQKNISASLKASARRGITREGFDPLASNIVLHELDTFLMRLKRIVDRGRQRAITPTVFNAARSALAFDQTAFRLVTQRNRTISLGPPQDPYLRRINYSRFADDFIIGIIGPRILAVRIEELMRQFLKVKLGIQAIPEPFVIHRAKGSKVPFLGYFISRNPERIRKFCRRDGDKWITYRFEETGSLCFLVDMDKVIRRLSARGFCDKSGNPKPNFKYYQYPQEKSVIAVGNILRGLANYFHLADSKRQCVNRLSYILRSSLAKTYAAKFKLGSSAKVFKRGGKNLSRPIKVGGIPPTPKKGAFPLGTRADRVERPRRPPAIPFTKYREISHPDKKALPRDWQPRRAKFLSMSG